MGVEHLLVPEETVVATPGGFVNFLLLLISCQDLPADQVGSCGMAIGFGKLFIQKTTTNL